MTIDQIVQIALAAFMALVGFPNLLALVLTVAEYFGWLSEEGAGVVSFWTNLVVFGGILVAAALGKIDIVTWLDTTFGNVAQLLAYILVILGIPTGALITKAWRSGYRKAGFFAKRLM